MHALVDADILLYRIGFTTENEDVELAVHRMDEFINRVLDSVKATSCTLYLSDGRDKTFRAELNPEYKATRVQPKPLHYGALKQHLIDVWQAEVQVGQEADDALGIMQTNIYRACVNQVLEGAGYVESIICSIDKDLLQITGNHYNFVKEEFITIAPDEGVLFFYLQLLMGDKADNIPGVTGIGIAKATAILESYLGDKEETIFKVVQDKYRSWLVNEWADQYEEWSDVEEERMNALILKNGQCLKIRTYEGEVWQLPIGRKDASKVSSSQSYEEDIDDGLQSMNV